MGGSHGCGRGGKGLQFLVAVSATADLVGVPGTASVYANDRETYLAHCVQSSVNSRSSLTLVNLVGYLPVMTLANPVECAPALPHLPTGVSITVSA